MGVPSNVVVVALPQRFQIVTETSALAAGVRLLAYSSVSAVSAGVANIASKKARIPFIYFLILGSILHTIGVALLSTLPEIVAISLLLDTAMRSLQGRASASHLAYLCWRLHSLSNPETLVSVIIVYYSLRFISFPLLSL